MGPGTQPANTADWPFIVLVNPQPNGLCGGSVVASRWILSAAHCVSGRSAASMAVYPGASTQTAPGPRLTPDTALVNPGYVGTTYVNDFALLRIPSATSAPAIPMPGPSDDAAIAVAQGAAGTALIAGWGLVQCTPVGTFPGQECAGSPTDLTSNQLLTISGGIPLIPDAACGGFYGSRFRSQSMLCAGNAPSAAVRNDACSGDSGGPLTAVVNGRRLLLGLTSWGYLCGQPNLPGVYAKVPAARDWICDTVTSPTEIEATGGRNSVTVTWSPDATTCPWRDPQVRVIATPGGATATASLSAGRVTFSGLPRATAYSFSATVASSTGADPPPAVASAATSALPDACTQSFLQQDARAAASRRAPNGTRAVRVVSRLRIYDDPEPACRVDLTFIFVNRKTGARIPQLPGSTLGFRRLTGKDFSAPVVGWPTAREFRFEGSDSTGLGRKDARLVLVSFVKKTASLPAQSNIELVVVRRIPKDPAVAPGGSNPLFAQKNGFGTAAGWATVT